MSIADQNRMQGIEERLEGLGRLVKEMQPQSNLADRVEKLEGELRALKARMGKNKEPA